ncbi:MAG: hypothetical protein AAGI48_12090 [Verrucomicrobiota bacterium]
MSELVKSANRGDRERVLELLGASEHVKAELDLALARACCSDHLEVAEVLLQHGADPNGQYETAEDEPDYGPIILASCEFLCGGGVAFLLRHGADPNGNPPESGRPQACTPLEMVRNSYMKNEDARDECERLLLEAGATG